jgi:hypothetical protein
MAKKPTIESIDASLARWKTRLKRAVNMIDKLEKQRKRLVKAAGRVSVPAYPTVDSEATLGALPPKPEPLAVTIMREMAAPVEPAKPDDGGIPDFLRRKSDPDQVAEQIRQEQAETKRRKAVGRIATMKAKKAGETRKMPLSGKAALAAIRNG